MKAEHLHQLKKKIFDLVPEAKQIKIHTQINIWGAPYFVIAVDPNRNCYFLSDNKIYSEEEIMQSRGFEVADPTLNLEDIMRAIWRANLDNFVTVRYDGHFMVNGNRWNQWVLGVSFDYQPEDVKIFLYTLLCTTEI